MKNNKLIKAYYADGNRLRLSFLKKERVVLFSKWIGENNKVLNLGGKDGTLTKYFCKKNQVTIGDIDE